MAQITYTDKTALNVNGNIADTNKVNASDMNEIKNVVNTNYTELTTAINERNIIHIGLSANTNVTVGTTWTHYQIPINNVTATLGTKLTFNSSTKRVVVGDGVNNVRVSSFVGVRGIQAGIEYNIRKNGTSIASTNCLVANAGYFVPSAITDLIVPVSSGDYFDVTIRSAATGTAIIAGVTNFGLTVEVIN